MHQHHVSSANNLTSNVDKKEDHGCKDHCRTPGLTFCHSEDWPLRIILIPVM